MGATNMIRVADDTSIGLFDKLDPWAGGGRGDGNRSVGDTFVAYGFGNGKGRGYHARRWRRAWYPLQ